jgi:hypothetical protein
MEGRVNWGNEGLDEVCAAAGRWREVGATHLSIGTMRAGFASLDEHLGALGSVAQALELRPA